MADSITYISLSQINDSKDNNYIRDDIGDLTGLKASLEEFGMLQPVIVTLWDGKYDLIAGFRRVAAARLSKKIKEIPAIVMEGAVPSGKRMSINFTENLQRKTLNPVEEGKGFKKFLDEGFDLKGLCKLLSVNEAYVKARVALMDYPKHIQDAVIHGVPVTHAAEINRAPEIDHADLIALASDGISVEKLRKKVDDIIQKIHNDTIKEKIGKPVELPEKEDQSFHEEDLTDTYSEIRPKLKATLLTLCNAYNPLQNKYFDAIDYGNIPEGIAILLFNLLTNIPANPGRLRDEADRIEDGREPELIEDGEVKTLKFKGGIESQTAKQFYSLLDKLVSPKEKENAVNKLYYITFKSTGGGSTTTTQKHVLLLSNELDISVKEPDMLSLIDGELE